MATITLPPNPELTPERAQEVFAQGFAGRYEVEPTKILGRDFIVKKSGWAGIGVKVKQGREGTTFIFTPVIPSVLLRLLFGGLFSYLFLRPQWKALEAEVAEFIRTAPAFQAGAQPIEPAARQREAA